jgi:cytochrome c peroxidase
MRHLPINLMLIVGTLSCEPTAPSSPPSPSTTTATSDGFTRTQLSHIEAMAARELSDARDETNEVSSSPQAASLGHQLFFDRQLSSTHTVSCATCHQPDHGFSLAASVGMGQEATPRHPPTLLNVAHQRWFDWDGKADSLWAQAARPLENPAEHAISRTAIARHIALDAKLRAMYDAAYPDHALPDSSRVRTWPLDAMPGEDATPEQLARWEALPEEDRAEITLIFTRVLKALAAYEAKLTRVDSRFDRWVEWRAQPEQERVGPSPLTQQEVRGLQHFVGDGRCITCHNGTHLSDMDFHNLGLGARPWLINTPADRGRADGARQVKSSLLNASGEYSADHAGERARWTKFLMVTPENLGQFKTPTLRNVDLTPPYMHGGHFETLEEVVRFYVNLDEDVQTGHREESLRPVNLSVTQQLELVAFLKALTGAEPDGERAVWFKAPAAP